MLRILIADDHQISRKGIKAIFKKQPDMVVTVRNQHQTMEVSDND
jgi:DNA-binding NarL/FixJ family response regulator